MGVPKQNTVGIPRRKKVLDDEQMELRRKTLNASEFAAIVGEHPFMSAADVYASKVYAMRPWSGSKFTEAGQYMEDSILDWAEDELGMKLQRDVKVIKPGTIFACTLDARCATRKAWGVEAKFVSGFGEHATWGAPMSDSVPMYIYVQCQMQCYVAGLDTVWVAIFHGKDWSFKLYRVDRNDIQIEILVQRGEAFWQDHVLSMVPPPDQVPRLEVLKRIVPQPGTKCRLDPALARDWIKAKKQIRTWERHKSRLERQIRMAMGEHHYGEFGDVELVVRCQEVKRRGYTKVVPEATFSELRTVKHDPEIMAIPIDESGVSDGAEQE